MLAGRVAVITGAGRGIGAAAAVLLGRQGARVVVNDLDAAQAESVADAVRKAGGSASAFAGSVAERGFPEQLLEHASREHGGVHILVNNAGFLWDTMLHKMKDDQWDAIIDVHLNASFRLIRAAAPHMRDAAKREVESAGGGAPSDRCIINVSSTSGLHGNVGQANYAAAKAGLIGLTKTVAKEWGPLGIRANAVAFGMIETRLTSAFEEKEVVRLPDGSALQQGLTAHVAKAWESGEALKMMVPLGRKGSAEEAAGGIMLLASPLASYVSGHVLEVTGGMGI